VSFALTSRWFAAGAGPQALIAGLKAVGLPTLVLHEPPPQAVRWREPLRAEGVRVLAVRLADVEGLVGTGAEVVGALKPARVLVPAGALAPMPPSLLGGAPSDEERLAHRQRVRERQVEVLARTLHGPLAAGWPLAALHGTAAGELLLLEETGWLLDALPRLGLWLDPARLLALERSGGSPGPAAWADRFAGRVVGVSVHGLGSDGQGHAHPEDDGPAWGRLAASLPRWVPWALDLSGRLTAADVREALRYMTAAFAADT